MCYNILISKIILFILILNWTQTLSNSLIENSVPNITAGDKTPKMKKNWPSNDKQWYYKNALEQWLLTTHIHNLKRNKETLKELKLFNERYDQEPANKGKKHS